MITSKIDKLGRVVIPISYRQKLNVKTDDTLVFSLENDAVVIRPQRRCCRLCGGEVTHLAALPLCDACISHVKEL